MQKLKKHAYYFFPPLLTLIVLAITYLVKGVYPFGSGNIAYYDISQQYIPLYLRNYDIFHGSESMIFDWFTGAGSDTFEAFPGYTLHPINWLFFFISKDHVYEFLSFFLLIKLMISSLTMSVFTKKNYDLPLLIHTAICLMYTYSGYVMQFYTNIFFLDAMMLLPLTMLALKSMFKGGKEWPYMLLIAFTILTGSYMGYMVLFFVLFYSFGLMLTVSDKMQRRKYAARIGLYTFTGIALSGITLIPVVTKLNNGARTNIIQNTYLSDLLAAGQNSFFNQKTFVAFNTELAAALLILAVINLINLKKKPSREFMFRVYLFVIMLMPILFEGTNLIWHMGSYVHFPYRNGFMFTFAAAELIAYQYQSKVTLPLLVSKKGNKNNDLSKSKNSAQNNKILMGVLTAVFSAASLIFLIKLDLTFMDYGIHLGHGSFDHMYLIYFLGTLGYVFAMCISSEKIKNGLIFALILLHVGVTSVGFIAPLKYASEDAYTYYVTRDKPVKDSIKIKNSFQFENDNVSRIKMLNPALAMNYPLIVGMPSVSQWTNQAAANYFYEICMLGYDYAYLGNVDSGGTIFSDAILNNKKLLVYGDVEVPEQLYSNPESIDEYSVYDMNYTLPFGMLMDEKILETESPDTPALAHQNQIYHAFSDSDDDLISFIEKGAKPITSALSNDFEYTYQIKTHIDKPSVIYACAEYSTEFIVNGEKKKMPYFDETDNTAYPRYMLPGIVTLGTFDNGDVEITINTDDSFDYEDDSQKLMIGVLPLEKMDALSEQYKNSCVSSYIANKNTLKMTADVSGNNYLFLPLEYLEGWKATVNGKPAEVFPVIDGAFMAVKLPDGHCDIDMTYMPKNFTYGVILSIAGVCAAAMLIVMKKLKKDLTDIEFINKAAYVIFGTVAIAALVLFNINPIFANIVNGFSSLVYSVFK